MPSRQRSSAGPRSGSGDNEPARARTAPGNTLTVAGFRLPVPNAGSKRVLWWGGLAALAAVGVIEWPVAVVVGAGSYVAERLTREDVRHDAAERN